jgi:septin family protein
MIEDKMKCELCERENLLTFHHLITVCLHTNKWFKKNYTREELKKGINICKEDCHKEIHKLITEKEMGRSFNTLEKLKRHPKIKKYIKWVKSK